MRSKTTEKTCKCGRVWEITMRKIPQRDSDSIKCRCGETLESWNGGVTYSHELIRGLPEDER
jgi:hypothetical protein